MSFIKQKTLGLFVKTGGLISQPILGGKASIFMLHRVLPDYLRSMYDYNKDLAITPEILESFIIKLQKKNYLFISIDELFNRLNNEKWGKDKYICFTIDDGYRDNISYGLPVFEKYNIPFTIYVTNCFPNRTAHFWWYWLEQKVRNNTTITFQNKLHESKTSVQKGNVYKELSALIKDLNVEERTLLLTDFFDKSSEQIRLECEELALSWEEIKEVSNHPLVTIGAHTLNHYSLAHLSASEMKNEILQGKVEMEEKIGRTINHFAYPYGSLNDANKREFEMVKKLGFKTATLNHCGNIFKELKEYPEQLPRYSLGNNIEEEKFSNYLNGIMHFSVNGWSKIPAYE